MSAEQNATGPRTERIGIVGGGIVGVALGRHLGMSGAGEVTIIEKERRVGMHQTGHNSGVVHAGLYYAPGSLKAVLCARGREATQQFCEEKNLPYREIGKLVVAVTEDDLAGLGRIEDRARSNGVPDLERVGPARMREIEPHAAGVAALHSPHTAVVDYVAITEAMAQDVRRSGGRIVLGQEVIAIREDAAGIHVRTSSSGYCFDRLIVCAGLQSDVVARYVGGSPSPRILPFRGEYWAMTPESEHLVNGMIYPIPDPAFPFLGIHFTRGVYDDVHVGPNAVPGLAREGYGWRDVSVKDIWGSVTWPGAFTLAQRHWRMGSAEIAASLIKPLYFREARRFVPELKMRDLAAKSASGVRAQAWADNGELLDDFAVDRIGRVTLIRNAPSPAATSAIAIAEYVTEHYLQASE